jgi:hypothetical protein
LFVKDGHTTHGVSEILSNLTLIYFKMLKVTIQNGNDDDEMVKLPCTFTSCDNKCHVWITLSLTGTLPVTTIYFVVLILSVRFVFKPLENDFQ